ncbi:hypothetical protein ABIE13_004840 [Ottowia thiooxydans]|uniref:Uncharacterized protein n=1 Tax=Ottowia thiooxydans TaxID=219182 RepID=A0ABV2QGJ6_9BURK
MPLGKRPRPEGQGVGCTSFDKPVSLGSTSRKQGMQAAVLGIKDLAGTFVYLQRHADRPLGKREAAWVENLERNGSP